MKILALDTSTEYCSVALSIDGAVDSRDVRAGQRHSELLLGMVDALLTAHGLHVRDLDGIAYGEGPGSFTGLRIGCGVVQGLAFGAGLPVVGVGTMLAMAAGTDAQRVVCCIDACVREIYHAAFRRVAASHMAASKRTGAPSAPLRGGERTGETHGFPRDRLPLGGYVWEVVHAPSVCAPADAPELPDGEWYGCGSGFAAYREALDARYAGRLSQVEADRYPLARDIARLAVPLFEAGATRKAEEAAPVYLRDKVALRTDERANR